MKIGFLYNFTRFVEWPRDAFEHELSPLVIGIAGDQSMAALFASVLANKPAGGRHVEVRHIPDSGKIPNCHVLFLRAASRRKAPEVANELAGRHVLLVGEEDRFLARGGMVNFLMSSDRVRFEINLAPVRKCGLVLDSKLVGVAERVLQREGAGE
ncbi:MAG: YfiR family protein [Candidatus Eisenbacteria bacterium]|nr:YfiR family protein [Candidatus Eisenbacteria bacterium]